MKKQVQTAYKKTLLLGQFRLSDVTHPNKRLFCQLAFYTGAFASTGPPDVNISNYCWSTA